VDWTATVLGTLSVRAWGLAPAAEEAVGPDGRWHAVYEAAGPGGRQLRYLCEDGLDEVVANVGTEHFARYGIAVNAHGDVLIGYLRGAAGLGDELELGSPLPATWVVVRRRGRLPESFRPDLETGWREVRRVGGFTNSVWGAASGTAEAIGPDGRWHCIFEETTASTRDLTYLSETGETGVLAQIPLASRFARFGITSDARGDILVGYASGTPSVNGAFIAGDPAPLDWVLLRRRNQLQRWETTSDGGQFVPVAPGDVAEGRIDPGKPTVVLVHGWNNNGGAPPSCSLNEEAPAGSDECKHPMGIWRCLARAMAATGSVNVLAWDWLYEARSRENTLLPAPGEDGHLEKQARRLLAGLASVFSGHSRRVQLIGHSLGGGVVAYSGKLSTPSDGIERITLMDVPEKRGVGEFGAPRLLLDCNVIPKIRAETEIAIDNYFSLAGCGYKNLGANDVNVDLTRATRFLGLIPAVSHGYPRDWYLDTVRNPSIAQMHGLNGQDLSGEHAGWWWSPANGSPASSARAWFTPLDHEMYAQNEPSVCDQVVGGGNQGSFPGGNWRPTGNVEQSEGLVTLREGSPASIAEDLSFPADISAMRFDYVFENKGDGDCLSVYWNDELLWTRTGTDFEGGDFETSGYTDLSLFCGASGVLNFALESVGEANAVIHLRNLEFAQSLCADCYRLVVLVDGEGTVSPAGGMYDPGTVVDVRAIPSEGWRFDHWELDVPPGSETAEQITVAMDADCALLAVFKSIGSEGPATENPDTSAPPTESPEGAEPQATPAACGTCGAAGGLSLLVTLAGLVMMRRRWLQAW
jgi:hypothetical protein